MTVYTPIAILAFSVLGLASIVTVHLSRMNRRLDIQEAEIRQLWNRITSLEIALAQVRSAENQNALDICRIGDMASDTCTEVTTHARVLDNHTDRLSALEGEQ